MIIREYYLEKIRPFYDKDLIKVITGIRRCGKSVLMKQIIDEIKKTVDEKQIIYMNLEDYSYSKIDNADSLHEYVKELIKNKKKYYLFIDEVQNVKDWEKVINSFKSTMNISIFLTGSNSKLLSGELATNIAGRYVSFKIMPFSFKEVCEMKKIDTSKYDILEETFNDYLKWGGFPQRFEYKNEDEIIKFISEIYDSIVLKDIISRNKVNNINALNLLAEYFVTTSASIFSGSALSKYFQSEKRDISKETIYNYFEYMKNACVFNVLEKYDIRGKRILTKKDKYYLSDLSFTRIFDVYKKIEMGQSLENIVYNELLKRGYTLYSGDILDKEIDFIAIKDGEKIYIQVAYILYDEEVVKREFGAYDKVPDNYKKYVLSMDRFDFSQNGIIHKNVIKWLLED